MEKITYKQAFNAIECLPEKDLEKTINDLYCRFYDEYHNHPMIELLYDSYDPMIDKEQWEAAPTKWKIDFFSMIFANFLKKKNENYGDSAINPNKIFSKLDADNSILIRLDDKMNRIMNSNELRMNDFFDVMGYMWLYILTKPEWINKIRELID